MAKQTLVFRMPMQHPADVTGLRQLIVDGELDPAEIVAILGKTEGNGCVNDFTRAQATQAFADFLSPYLRITSEEVKTRIACVMSGGTEGVLSPHATVFGRRAVARDAASGAGARLALGVAFTREFKPEELGRSAQVEETARAVAAAMTDAGIADANEVHFVQIKCPQLTATRVSDARRRGHTPVTDDTYASMGYSRGASALGTALALGEIAGPVADHAILGEWRLFSSVASASAGIELNRSVVVVLGNSPQAVGDCRIGHAVMRDAIDLARVIEAFASVGLNAHGGLSPTHASRVVNVFAKAEASPDGRVRGERHTMLDDSDIHSTRHARAAVGGLISGVAGTSCVYVSGGAEHQGPPGGGPIAVIARVS